MLTNQHLSAAAAAVTLALTPKLPFVGRASPWIKIGVGVAAVYLSGKIAEGAAKAVLVGAAIGLAIDGALDLVPGLT